METRDKFETNCRNDVNMIFYNLISYEISLFILINSTEFLILRINYWYAWVNGLLHLKLPCIFIPFPLHYSLTHYSLSYL